MMRRPSFIEIEGAVLLIITVVSIVTGLYNLMMFLVA